MRIGSIGYATAQGLGHLMKSFYDAGIITDPMIYRHPHGEERSPTHREWYPEGTPVVDKPFHGELFERFLDDLDAILYFETPFDWNFANRCRERGVKTVIIPMYEWFLQNPSHQFDLFINPSLLDQQYFPQGVYIPIPVENDIFWAPRLTSNRFLHNAGNIGSRNHKGTLELLYAMRHVTAEMTLTVRCQNTEGIRRLANQAGVLNDPRIKFVDHEVPREQLFTLDHDVYIAPEKYNGLSLPLQEAFAAGMLVMTSNRIPHNTWLPNEILIPVAETRKAQTMRGHLEFEESIIDPVEIARCIDRVASLSVNEPGLLATLNDASGDYRSDSQWKALAPCYREVLSNLIGE